MRKFFTFFALAAFALVAGVSCQDPEVDTDPAVLTVGELAEISAGGGNCTLSYSVENPIEGEVVTATVPAEATWVHDITVGENAVEFVVDANNGDARSTTMTISYANLSPVEVTISQAKASDITIGMLAKIPAAGGNASFTYSVVAVEGATLTATVDDETTWIHDINVTATAVEFVVDANTSTSERMAVITLSYAGADKDVTITQEGAAPVGDAFEVSFSNVTSESAYVSVTPASSDVQYMILNTKKSTLNTSTYAGETIEEKAVSYVLNEAKSALFSFWGANMDKFHTGAYPAADAEEGENYQYWMLTDETDVPYIIVCGVDTTVATREELTAEKLTTEVMVVEVPLLPAPVITLSRTTLDVASDAGSNGLSFQIENPVENADIQAKTNAKWIKNIKVVNDKVVFEYDENPYGVARTATITFTYDFALNARTLTVNQAANPAAENITFKIDVVEAHWDHVLVNVTPSNKEVAYVLNSVSLYDYENLRESSDEKIIANDFRSSYSVPTTRYVGDQTNLKVTSAYYVAGKEKYYIYAYAIDDKTTPTMAVSGVSKAEATTVLDKPSFMFECSDSSITVTPGDSKITLKIPATAGTYTVSYSIVNVAEGGNVVVEASTTGAAIDRSTLVHDAENKTITFSVNEYASGGYWARNDYIYLKYYEPGNETFTAANGTISISQAVPAN